MKAFNSSKGIKEHKLFLKKQQWLSFTNKENLHCKIKVEKNKVYDKTQIVVHCAKLIDRINFDNCYKHINRILRLYTITYKIKQFEKGRKLKIQDLNLTRKDFAGNMDIEKIFNRVKEYDKNKGVVSEKRN